ncbi:multidrug transporter, partial [Pseudomonas syringae]
GAVVGRGRIVREGRWGGAGCNVEATGKGLGVGPGKEAFVRCWGCTGGGYGTQQ